MVSSPQVSPTKSLYTPLSSTTRSTCPAYLILLDFITRTILGEQYRSLSFSLCSFLHSPVTSSLLGPNILLNTLFSNILSLRSSLNVSDQVSHLYKTAGKIIVQHSLSSLFILLYFSVRERDQLEDPGLDGRILEWIFMKMRGRVWCLKTEQVAVSCEHGNEPSGSINRGESVDCPRN